MTPLLLKKWSWRHLMSFWFPWFQRPKLLSHFYRYLEVLPQSALDVKFDWLGPQKSLIFLGSQIHPRYQILFQVLDASLFCVLIGGPNSFLLWRIQSSQEKVKAPWCINCCDGLSWLHHWRWGGWRAGGSLWYYGFLIPFLNWSLNQFIHFPIYASKFGKGVSFEPWRTPFSSPAFEADRPYPQVLHIVDEIKTLEDQQFHCMWQV